MRKPHPPLLPVTGQQPSHMLFPYKLCTKRIPCHLDKASIAATGESKTHIGCSVPGAGLQPISWYRCMPLLQSPPPPLHCPFHAALSWNSSDLWFMKRRKTKTALNGSDLSLALAGTVYASMSYNTDTVTPASPFLWTVPTCLSQPQTAS